MDLQLSDKVAVVTGGSVGIGLAIARGLAAEGVHLVLCARDPDRLHAVAGAVRTDFPVRVIGVPADVGTAEGGIAQREGSPGLGPREVFLLLGPF